MFLENPTAQQQRHKLGECRLGFNYLATVLWKCTWFSFRYCCHEVKKGRKISSYCLQSNDINCQIYVHDMLFICFSMRVISCYRIADYWRQPPDILRSRIVCVINGKQKRHSSRMWAAFSNTLIHFYHHLFPSCHFMGQRTQLNRCLLNIAESKLHKAFELKIRSLTFRIIIV